MKIFEGVVELICWLQIFLCPAATLGFIGFVIYKRVPAGFGVASFVLCLILGVVLGIYWAERIRRTIGCASFVGRSRSHD